MKRYAYWIVTDRQFKILKKCPFYFSFQLELILEDNFKKLNK